MKLWKMILRLGLGLALVVSALAAGLAVIIPWMHTYGATQDEIALELPGDQLQTDSLIRWTHAVTIEASPDQVWPWIAQMGDTRGGFYTYTFIENRVGALTGAAGYNVVYHNADYIVSAWQNPRPGDEIIQGVLKIRSIQPGMWLLADSTNPETLNWTWLWYLVPAEDNQQTRLIVRFGIETPSGEENRMMQYLTDLGGFIMERNMLQGIRLRAQGGYEPGWIEGVEIALWCVAVLAGFVAGAMFIVRSYWQLPLGIGLVALVVVLLFTFVQPAIWVRSVLNAVLIGGMITLVIRK